MEINQTMQPVLPGQSMMQPYPVYPKETAEMKEAKAAEKAAARAGDFAAFFKTAALFGALYAVCLYRNPMGITWPLYMAGFLLLTERLRKCVTAADRQEGGGWNRMHLFYIVVLMLLSVSKCTTASYALLYLDNLCIFFLMLCYLLHLFVDGGAWNLSQHMQKVLLLAVTPVTRCFRPLTDFFAWKKLRPAKEGNSERRRDWQPVLIGVVIALPLLLLVTGLLGSADLVFGRLTERIIDALRIEHLPDVAEDVVRITLTFACALIAYYAIATRLKEQKLATVKENAERFPAVTAITVAIPLSIVYAVFCLIQIVYLFLGKMRLPQGYTYAEYAHEGFYQLLFVSALNLLLVQLGTSLFVKNKWLNALLTFLSGCTYIMIASSVLRMVMYVRVYHLTFLRLFVLWFLVVLAVLLTGVIASVYTVRVKLFSFGVVTVVSLYLVFALAHPDELIARYNIAQTIAETGDVTSLKHDSYLCYHLSSDAAPVLAEHGLEHFNALRYEWEKKSAFEKVRTFNLSKWRALRAGGGV